MSVKKNVIANYFGQGWNSLLGIAFVPIYLRYLGVEAYGLVGVYMVLQAFMAMLDMGLTPTLNREMARLKAGARSAGAIRDLLRSMECICAGLGMGMVSILWFAAPWIVARWLKVTHLPLSDVVNAVRVMAFVAASRWWEQIYRAAILGAQDQVRLNVLSAIMATMRWAGAGLVLAFISKSVFAFFAWQGLVSLLSVGLFAGYSYRLLPPSSRGGRFSTEALRQIGRFTGAVGITMVLAFLWSQVDKILLSRLLPLQEFAHYTLASTAANALGQLAAPLTVAVYPTFSTQFAAREFRTLATTYQSASQWVAAIVIAPALVLCAFSNQILWLWTGNTALSATAAPLLSVLAIGAMLSVLTQLPYLLLLASGAAGLGTKIYAIAVAIVVPSMFLAVSRFGAIGAAYVGIALNAAYILFGVPFMHRRVWAGVNWLWYRDTVFLPLMAGASLSVAIYAVLPRSGTWLVEAIYIGIALAVVASGVAFAMPTPRRTILGVLRQSRQVVSSLKPHRQSTGTAQPISNRQ